MFLIICRQRRDGWCHVSDIGIERGLLHRHPGARRTIGDNPSPLKKIKPWFSSYPELKGTIQDLFCAKYNRPMLTLITVATSGQSQSRPSELSRSVLSRILRGEILFKTVLSRPWRYERYWQSIYGNSGRPRVCRKRNWRIAPRSIGPISVRWSEASMLPASTLSTGWRVFSVLRPPTFSSVRPRMGIERKAGASLALVLKLARVGKSIPRAGPGGPASRGRGNAPAADLVSRIC